MSRIAKVDLVLSCEIRQDGSDFLFADIPDLDVGRHMCGLPGFSGLQDLNQELFQDIETLIQNRTSGREDLMDLFHSPENEKLLNSILGIRFPANDVWLEDIFREVIQKSKAEGSVPVVELNNRLSFIPWEILPIKLDGKNETLLGDHCVFVSDLLQDAAKSQAYELQRKSKIINPRFKVRAAGDHSIAFSDKEKSVIENLPSNSYDRAEIAAPISSAGTVRNFFEFFSQASYDVFHIYGHCNYVSFSSSTSQFELSFSNAWMLKYQDFIASRAKFCSNSIGLINVCSAFPASPQDGVSPAEYFALEQGVHLIFASLFPIRSSEAVNFAELFYTELLPSVRNGGGAQYAAALLEARCAASKNGDLSPFFYRPIGDTTTPLFKMNEIERKLYG